MSTKKAPVTVMLGFFGATPRYLQKYANTVGALDIPVNSAGASPVATERSTVVTFQPPMKNLLARPIHMRSTERLAQLVSDTWIAPHRAALAASPSAAPTPLVFYLLSNNGAWNFAHYLTYLRDTAPADFALLQEHTSGIVFDSAPCDPAPDVMVRGVTTVATAFASKQPKAHASMLSPLLSSFFSATMPARAHHFSEVTDGLHKLMPAQAAKLFLLSQADDLIYYNDSLAYAREQAARSATSTTTADISASKGKGLEGLSAEAAAALASVTEHPGKRVWVENFVTSGHMDHLRKHPARYKQLVKSFYEEVTRNS